MVHLVNSNKTKSAQMLQGKINGMLVILTQFHQIQLKFRRSSFTVFNSDLALSEPFSENGSMLSPNHCHLLDRRRYCIIH